MLLVFYLHLFKESIFVRMPLKMDVIMNTLPKVTGIGIHLKVRDIAKSRVFYESLGLQPAFAYGDSAFVQSFPKGMPTAPEKYRGVTYHTPTGDIEIAEGHIAVSKREVFAEQITSPKLSAMLKVESLVPVLKQKTFQLKFPVRHYYWGTIEAAFRDPDGFVIVAIAPYSEKEFQEVSKIVKIEVIKS